VETRAIKLSSNRANHSNVLRANHSNVLRLDTASKTCDAKFKLSVLPERYRLGSIQQL